ncbi:DUF5009 domain-containing protein [Paucibacter soli]|uniref:DUF5009 domain-containing protein n=1 Tax=Paucibacter soli TaxID=3133433 RepID=UPI00309E02F4
MSESQGAGRSLAIDAFRALTVLLMITVNEWHGVAGLPAWMKHYPADADAMSFVDMVFPAFLFIVGMSIPLALRQRMAAGESQGQVLRHVLLRALGLVVIGVFMVNAEDGFLASAMPMPIAAWALLSYLAAFLVWGSLRGGPALAGPWRAAGVLLLLALAWAWRGGADGSAGMRPQWWGILGLIGWAYLLGCLAFMLTRGRRWGLLLALALGLLYYARVDRSGHVVHGLIVVCGSLCTLIFFDAGTRRFAWALAFASGLALLATLLRPAYGISKIHATPSWALYSAAACVLVFALLHWQIDRRGRRAWTAWLRSVAAHPLLAYLIPFVVGAAMELLHWQLPAPLRSVWPGVLWGPAYALLVLLAVRALAARGLRLRI